MRICVVTFPVSEAGTIPLSNLLSVLGPLCSDVYLITGNAGYALFRDSDRIHTYEVEHKVRTNPLARMASYLGTQSRIAYQLARLARNVDICLFFIGGEGLLLPMFVARLFGRKVLLSLAGFPSRGGRVQKDPLSGVTGWASRVGLILSNRIIVYSERVVKERRLEKYGRKISLAREHFLGDKFSVTSQVADRRRIVGYIGALTQGKGIPELLQAVPKVLKKECIEFLIAGEGDLSGLVHEFITREGLGDKVRLLGWIPHDELPKYLNELKLLVLPSYTEGLPNIVLEAMACGTPVLVTAVGAVPDIVTDGETGFILEDNSPETIARRIVEAVNCPDLDRIAKNARALIEKEFAYQAAVGRYRDVLASLQ